MMRQIATTLGALLLACLLWGCDVQEGGKMDTTLDSTGSRLERGVDRAGEKLDTAWTNMKTQANEVQIEAALGKIKGMEDVDVELDPQGQVHLTGTVNSQQRRMFAEQIVKEMEGVAGVTNQIAITPGGDTTGTDTIVTDTTVRRDSTRR